MLKILEKKTVRWNSKTRSIGAGLFILGVKVFTQIYFALSE